MEKVRQVGAKWEFSQVNGREMATWSPTKNVPGEATHLEIVVLYTDLMYHPPHKYERLNRQGDAPGIVASWSADLKQGTWEFKANTELIVKSIPKVDAKYADAIKKVRAVVTEKTPGFLVMSRPFNYLPNMGIGAENEILGTPNAGYSVKAIIDMISNAVNALIISTNDTGFDIVDQDKQKDLISSRK